MTDTPSSLNKDTVVRNPSPATNNSNKQNSSPAKTGSSGSNYVAPTPQQLVDNYRASLQDKLNKGQIGNEEANRLYNSYLNETAHIIGGMDSGIRTPSQYAGQTFQNLQQQQKEAQQKAQQAQILQNQARAARQAVINQQNQSSPIPNLDSSNKPADKSYQLLAEYRARQAQQQIKAGTIVGVTNEGHAIRQGFAPGVTYVDKKTNPNPQLKINQTTQRAPEPTMRSAQQEIGNVLLAHQSNPIRPPNPAGMTTIQRSMAPESNPNGKFIAGPYIYQKQTGVVKDESTGRTVPQYGPLNYAEGIIDKQGNVIQGERPERIATPEEAQQFKQFNAIESIKSYKTDILTPALRGTGEALATLKQDLYRANMGTSTQADLDSQRAKIQDVFTTINSPINKVSPKTAQFLTGAETSFVSGFVEKPVTQALIIGAGYGTGYAVEGLPILAKAGGSLISDSVGTVLGTTTKGITTFGSLGLGGYYVAKTGGKILAAKSPGEAGDIFGNTIREATLFGVGYKFGVKRADITQGYLATRGREEIPLDLITKKEIITGKEKFLLLPKAEQLPAFEKGKFALPGEEVGGYHSTPQNFFKPGQIEAKAGTSELPGLYISPGVSPAFLKIKGYGSSYDLLPNFDDLFKVNEPAIAYLKPKGFRISDYISTKPYLLDEQPFKFAFKNKAIPGIADVPLMKTEAEAIIRPGTGSYLLEKNNYYTTVNNVRVPIDVFKYQEGMNLDILKSNRDMFKDLAKGGFNPSKYSSLRTSPIIEPRSFSLFPSKRSSYPSSRKIDIGMSRPLKSSNSSSFAKSSSFVPSSLALSSRSSSSRSSAAPSLYFSSSLSRSSIPSSIISSVLKTSRNQLSKISGKSSSVSSSSISNDKSSVGGLSLPSFGKKRKASLGFRTFIIRRGKEVLLPGTREKGAALRFGEKEARQTLAATFGIKETKKLIEGMPTNYKVNRNQFRNFRIRQQKRIPLNNEYIQFAKKRLSSSSEVSEILSAKRKKLRL